MKKNGKELHSEVASDNRLISSVHTMSDDDAVSCDVCVQTTTPSPVPVVCRCLPCLVMVRRTSSYRWCSCLVLKRDSWWTHWVFTLILLFTLAKLPSSQVHPFFQSDLHCYTGWELILFLISGHVFDEILASSWTVFLFDSWKFEFFIIHDCCWPRFWN